MSLNWIGSREDQDWIGSQEDSGLDLEGSGLSLEWIQDWIESRVGTGLD